MNFLVEKNVPIVNPRKMSLPLAEMVVGDSFVFAEGDNPAQLKSKRNGVGTHIRNNKSDGEFTTSIVPENGKYVVRVWRTK